MRHLIIDCGDRAFTALVVMPDGEVLTCSQDINGVLTRSVSSDVLFDLRISEDPDFIWEDAVDALASANPRNFFQKARRLGLRRPWDQSIPAETVRLPAPLAVLSSTLARLDTSTRSTLPVVVIKLLDALLEPIFQFLADRNFTPEGTRVSLILPANYDRKARLALYKVFRRRRFTQLTMLNREIAAALALLHDAPMECVVWDATGDDLHLHRVAVERYGNKCLLRTLASRTLRRFGWSYWLEESADSLVRAGHVERSSSLLPALDRALMGLLTGGQASLQLPSSSATRLSHGLLQEALCSEHERIELELRSLLESHLLALAVPPGVPSILLGPIFGLEPVAKLVLSLATGEQPLTVTSMPLLERTTRSVASALLWLQRDADRTIKTLPGGGIRLNTHSGDVVEILSREQFPEAGESCYVRRQFHFEGEIDPASPLLVQLQSGTDCSPEGNATLCLLPLQPPSSGSESTAFSLSLRLTRSASGRRLSGVAEATLVSDPTSSPASSFLIEDLGSPSISARSLS